MAIIENWKIISSKTRKKNTKTDHTTLENKSFYFIWPSQTNYALYQWYIIKDKWDMLDVWLMRMNTWESRECTIKKDIITLENRNDYTELRKDN